MAGVWGEPQHQSLLPAFSAVEMPHLTKLDQSVLLHAWTHLQALQTEELEDVAIMAMTPSESAAMLKRWC